MALTPRILLVDDNAALVENLRETLEEEGYLVASARTIAGAAQAATSGFDVALVDLRLPDGDGTALTEQLGRDHPDAAIVMLTGNATVATAAAVGTMTAGLSHEIRNPLNAASLQLVVLERRLRKLPLLEQPPCLEPLKLVRDEIARLEHLLQDFLQFARPRELSLRPLPLQPLVGAVADLLAGEAERRGVRLERDLPVGLPRVQGEDERLRQVLMNLALNALEATPRGGRIRILAQARSEDVWIAVEDSGSGIEPSLRQRIFEPFFSTKAAGSGLGLPIVHAIVTQHGGAVGVEPSLLGGARFWFTLQRAP